MPNTDSFLRLCESLAAQDLFGDGPPIVPWGTTATVEDVSQAIDRGIDRLPFSYREGYGTVLRAHLASLIVQQDPVMLETMVGAIYDHAPGSGVDPELDRFLAVVSNLYRSFLSKEKRAGIAVPLVEQLPPVAMFQHSGAMGPFTLPVDTVKQLIGADVGVVSLPSTYRAHPLLWASLAHETGGHDVTHADPGLLDELSSKIVALLGGGQIHSKHPKPADVMGLLWSYWVDEATADVYGLLNIGPPFCANLAAFFAALNAQGGRLATPLLRASSGFDPDTKQLDPHPTDILRIHLAIGVTEKLSGLSLPARSAYVAQFESLATLCAGGATVIEIRGYIPVERDRWVPLSLDAPIAEMQEAARRVGALIATAKLTALGDHSIQDIETWDDPDEATARTIAAALQADGSIASMGDDAQILAGTTLALVDQPDLYAVATQRVNEALDVSFRGDPIWGKPVSDAVFLRSWRAAELPGHAATKVPVGRAYSRRPPARVAKSVAQKRRKAQ